MSSQTERATRIEMKLEVVPIPVSDVDAAKEFYTEKVGFNLDNDVRPTAGMRVVQMTPPGSACSVVIGEGLPLGKPGSVKGVQLVVQDIEAARKALASRGVGVGTVQQMGPEGSPGSRYLFFEDPDGNGWAVQEYKRS
jgi:catechol 2,3-dioxygenase-like lactoylglutathione lyase family enzyme